MSFYEQIKISPIHWGRKWKVLEDINYTIFTLWKPLPITIPKGFIFDGASIPRLFWIIGTPMWTDTLPGALIHDFIYRNQFLTRSEADQVFNEEMQKSKVRCIKRIIFYTWVRIWGWLAWKQRRKELVNSKL